MKKKLNNLTAAVLFALLCGLIPTDTFSQVTELISILYDRFSPTSSEHARPYFVKIDGAGDVYVIGDDGGNNNILIVKYNSSNVKLWQKQLPCWSTPRSAELDSEGNLFILYNDFPSSNIYWVTLAKVTPSGSTAWTTSIPSSYAEALQFQPERNYLVIGSSGIYVLARTVASANSDYFLIKFSHSGTVLWQKYYDSGTSSQPIWDFPRGITIDNNENIYITGIGYDSGYSPGMPTPTRNFSTVKYNSGGTLLWSAKYTRSPAGIYTIAADNSGNVYIGGSTKADTGYYFTTIKYNSSGIQDWAKYQKGTDYYGNFNSARKILIDRYGNPTVLGLLDDSMGVLGAVKYTPSGSQIWLKKYDDYSTTFCDFTFINSTDILISAKVYGYTAHDNIVLLKYDNNGILKWKTYYTSGYGDLAPEDMEATYDLSSGKTFFYVTSPVNSPVNGSDMLTAKFEEIDHPRPVANNTPYKYELNQNYPNPFNPQTKISFSIKKAGNVKLAVYDAMGREVSLLTNGQLEAGTYDIGFDASHLSSGVYFYKLESESFTDIKKMMLVK